MTSPAASLRLAARRALCAHLKELTGQKKGVLEAKDAERLHRMRVASRRMRTCLWLFKGLFPKKKYRTLQKQMRRLTRILGRARDLDTQLIFLRTLPEKPEGVRMLIAVRREQRHALQKEIAEAVTEVLHADLVNRALSAVGRASRTKNDPVSLLAKRTRRRLKEFLSWDKAGSRIDTCRDTKKLHALRIAAKHLRYSLEHLEANAKGAFSPFVLEAKRVQDILGDVQNLQVWHDSSLALRRKQPPRSVYLSGLQEVIRVCLRDREKALRDFALLWKDQRKRNVWKKLNAALKTLQR
jgi:CHAD domain-containing protein